MKRINAVIALILVSAIVLSLVLLSQIPRFDGIIRIRADGSINQLANQIMTSDNLTYALATNLTSSIVVERNDIVIDGNGHTVQDQGSNGKWGILLQDRRNVTVTNIIVEGFQYGILLNSSQKVALNMNTLLNNEFGIYLNFSSGCEVIGNNVTENHSIGIRLINSPDNILTSNKVQSNNGDGISLTASSANVLVQNIIVSHPRISVGLLSASSNNIIRENIMRNSSYGVRVAESSNNNLLQSNSISDQNDDGIAIDVSVGNTISGNSIMEGRWIDVWLRDSPSSLIIGNNLTSAHAFYFSDSSQNRIYHNSIMNDSANVTSVSSASIWDNGYPSGGNYWSGHPKIDFYSGPSQNIAGSDGICDTPFTIDDQNTDDYPLMSPPSS